ncbi:MAG: sugar phosphate isomerase/epimerase family protein [Phycisphaerae bacterium]
MKLAFSTNAFSRFSLEQALAAISAAGYTGVEILADKPHWYPDHFTHTEAAAVSALLQRYRLQVSNINANCTFGYWKDAPPEPFFEPSLISPDPKLRADRIRMIQNTLQFAQAIGASCISITSGKSLPTMPPEMAIQQLHESLRPVLELAEKLQIRVGIECEPGLFIEYATELRELIDQMGSPMLGANLDLGHSVVIGEDIPTILQILKGRIWNCHIEDLPGRKHYHLIPGTGTLDWPALHAALAAIRYDRFLTVELYTYPDRPAEAAQESITFLRKVFG